MSSSISHTIKNKTTSNDKFYTPSSLVKIHLNKFKDIIPESSHILEPFYGEGAYFNQMKEIFPTCYLTYTEIDMGLDFFEFDDKVDYIISNPPYSCIDKVLEKSVSLNPKIISYLIGFGNITAKRIQYMNFHGYFIQDFHLTKVYKWYGMSLIITFSNLIDKNIIEYDRIVHK
jgi:hypothetical protein